MDKNPFGPVPWDIFVFLAITGLGFAFSVQRYVQSHELGEAPTRMLALKHDVQRPNSPTLELGCLEKALLTERRTGVERQFRLAGQFCHLTKADMKRFGGLRVRNLTTGQEGTVFFHGFDNSFLTDTLSLAEGTNKIRLQWRETDGSPMRELTAEVQPSPKN